VYVRQGQTADGIARELFSAAGVTPRQVDGVPPPSGGMQPSYSHRGTAIQFLRALARPNGMYAAVLPGEALGAPAGHFRAFPTEPDGLPDLVLLGPGRNTAAFDVTDNAQRPASTQGSALSAADKQTTPATSSPAEVPQLGSESAAPAAAPAVALTRPGRDGAVDVRQTVRAATERASYALNATGRVTFDAYPGVLSPYRVVTVRGADGRNSGNWAVQAVTHTIDRTQYAQDFTLRRNARSSGSGAAPPLPPSGVF
jgi:hypothetical protein